MRTRNRLWLFLLVLVGTVAEVWRTTSVDDLDLRGHPWRDPDELFRIASRTRDVLLELLIRAEGRSPVAYLVLALFVAASFVLRARAHHVATAVPLPWRGAETRARLVWGGALMVAVIPQVPVVPAFALCAVAIELGAGFVARSFSGDRKQMIQLIKAAHSHKGIAVLDIISPCVTFNNHERSTKSYTFAKEHDVPLHELGYVPYYDQVEVDMKDGETREIELHDGSHLRVKKLNTAYDPSDKMAAMAAIHESRAKQELTTGLLYFNPSAPDLNALLNVTDTPLGQLKEKDLNPGPEVLKKICAGMR